MKLIILNLILIVFFLFVGHACKGVSDTLQFHFSESRFATYDNQHFWNPGNECDPDAPKSWENKYRRGPDGELIRPLEEKFPGSSTVFVATTDAWHLFQALQYACQRMVILLLLAPLLSLVYRDVKWWQQAIFFFVGYWILWAIQAAGFHLTYTLLN